MTRAKDKHYLFFKSDTKVMENAIRLYNNTKMKEIAYCWKLKLSLLVFPFMSIFVPESIYFQQILQNTWNCKEGNIGSEWF